MKHVVNFSGGGQPLAIDLFCGLGGWTEGLLAEGYRVVGFDNERHEYGEAKYPGQLVIQDVLTLHGSQFKDAALIVASPPCFVANTLILTTRGLIPIPEVATGDFVLTHRNRWRRVTCVGNTMSPTVLACGFGGFLEGTAEHPVYARRDEGSYSFWDKNKKTPANKPKSLGEPEWIPLAESKGCHWASPAVFEALPVPPLPNRLPDEPAFWWIVGRWIGDGWVRCRAETKSGDEVIICCGNSEANDLETHLAGFAKRSGKRAVPGEIHWRRSQERTTTRFTCASNALAEWLTVHFGKGAEMKAWPAWALGLKSENKQAMLDGYVSADGCVGRNGPSSIAKVTTVSKRLAIGTRLLVASLGAASNVFFTPRPHLCQIEGRTVKQRDTWSVTWTPDNASNRLVEKCDGFQWGKVREVEAAQDMARVWNLEVDEDNSYTADGIVVHNCQEYSYMAMPWTRAKRIAVEYRSGARDVSKLTALFDACFRIQREASEAAGRHIPLIVENVKGAQPWVGRAAWHFGSFYLWGDVPALMPIIKFAAKVPMPVGGDSFKVGFQQMAVLQQREGVKATGMNWSDQTKRGQDFTRIAGRQNEGIKHGGDCFNDPTWAGKQGGTKQSGISGLRANGKGDRWFQDGAARNGSKSKARKAASAAIAKIPFVLAQHIARAWKPNVELQTK